MVDNVIIRLKRSAGKDIIELPAELWEDVEAAAQRLRVSPEALICVALEEFIRKEMEVL